MDEWPVQCFKAYDIRGLANGDGTGELTPNFAYRLGRAMRLTLIAAPLQSDETFDIHLPHLPMN